MRLILLCLLFSGCQMIDGLHQFNSGGEPTPPACFPGWTCCAQLPSDFHPTWNCPGREALWNLVRNPFVPNLLYTAVKTDPMPGVSDWNPKGGFLFLTHKSGLPFLSYRGKHVEGYAGWKPPGTLGFALRAANAKGF